MSSRCRGLFNTLPNIYDEYFSKKYAMTIGCPKENLHYSRLAVSRFFYFHENLENVKEKPTRKPCFSRFTQLP